MTAMGLEGGWTLVREKDGSARPMTVPGDIMSALLEAGEILDPYKGRNELELQWIGREDWRIERDVELDAEDLASESIRLEAGVLDTVAEVWINGRLLGRSRNMFRRFRAEAKGLLVVGKNRISIKIHSPEREAAEAAANLAYPIPYSEYPVFSPHRNLIRKAQCMAGWDWGPCLMTGGIYDGIALVCADGPLIESATTRTRRSGAAGAAADKGAWDLVVDVELSSARAWRGSLEAETAGARARLDLDLQPGTSRHGITLRISGVEDWNPSGYGAQALYGLVVRCVAADSGHGPRPGAARGAEIRKKLGFREIEVVSREDEWGKGFHFLVNGRQVFAKGANWIPADALPSRWTRERLADLLGSAVAANMNCLRVWGGGRYESDVFYELCDELGLLVWQDCMFSCALYPSSRDFLGEVEAEIRDVVARLKDHPSIALWCGNNEALGAITWYEESKKNPARYIVDYDRLTEGTVGRLLRELDPDRTFWPSSPSAGPDDYADNWHADSRGDMHYWVVWHEGKPFSAYHEVKPRFCSEFGYQSLPSERVVSLFADSGDRNVTSPVFEHHQRHPRGNTIIVENMLRYFRMPSGFRETLYLSQVQQALAIRTAVEYWRGQRPRCMGALYWQLNDVWPVASWSSLEYDGGWKLLHHEARRFFEPVHLALVVRDGLLEAYAMNDSPTELRGRLGLSLLSFRARQGEAPVARFEAQAVVPPDSSVLLWSQRLADLPSRPEEAFATAWLDFGSEPALGGGSGIRKASAFLTEPKRCSLLAPDIESFVERSADGLSVRLRAQAPAFWVALDLDPRAGIEGRFDDSGFDLLPGEERVVRFRQTGDKAGHPDAAAFAKALRILDLEGSAR